MAQNIYDKRVKDIMSRDTVTLNAEDTVHEALTLMGENRVSALPVVNAHDQCVGILSTSDLVDMTRDVDDDLYQLDLVDSTSRRVRFYECLLRMRDTDGSLVAAGQFVPVLEQLGIVRMIDRHTLEMVFEQLDANPQVTLAVNISALTVTHPAWLRDLTALLRDRPDLAKRLIVEITETAALYDIEESARFVANVRDLGCQVALDDFGAGFTTFRHLKSLTVDLIKIDGSFVCGIAESPENQLFVRNLLSLAQSFGLETVAECVETQHQLDCLAQLGCNRSQGFLHGSPHPPEELRPPMTRERFEWLTGSEVLAR